jgi:hypothetical protein
MILRVNPFKVKKGDSGRLKNNKLTIIFGVTVATIILLILIKTWLSGKESGDVLPESVTQIFAPTKTTTEPVLTIFQPKKMSPSEARKFFQRKRLNKFGIDRTKLAYFAEQERIKNEFQKKIHLKINLPGDLQYTALDLEDDVEGIIGTTSSDDRSFSVLATNKVVSLNQILNFLNDETKGSLPVLEGHVFQTDKAFKESPPKETGLSDLTIFPSNEVNGKQIFAAFAERQDGKGSYLFMLKAETGYHEANDGAFDQMLQELRTQP